MKKHLWGKFTFVAVGLLIMLFVFTGCDGGVDDSAETGFARFADIEDSARSITTYGDGYGVNDLVWAYVAVKKDGLHTVGASVLDETKAGTDVVKSGQYDDNGYALRAVKETFGKGLGADIGPLSYGEWEFRIYGYKGYDAANKKFTDLVCAGTTYGSLVTIRPLKSGESAVSVYFKLATLETKGIFKIEDLCFTVPQNMTLFTGTAVTVTMSNATLGTFTATGSAASDSAGGTKIALTVSPTEKPNLAPGTYPLSITVKSTPSGGSAEDVTAAAYTYPVEIFAGMTTYLYGEVRDIQAVSGTNYGGTFGLPECKMNGVYYLTLLDAVNARTASSQLIVLLRDVKDVDIRNTTGYSTCIYLNGHTMTNVSYYTTTNAQLYLTLADGTVDGNKTIRGFGTNVKDIFRSVAMDEDTKTIWLDTDGEKSQYAFFCKEWDIWHTGRAGVVHYYWSDNDNSNFRGYHCDCNIDNELVVTGTSGAAVSDKALYLGGVDIKVMRFSVLEGNDMILRGTPNTKIGNIDEIENAYETWKSKGINSAFVKMTFHPGNLTGLTDVVKYGIRGMKMDIHQPFNKCEKIAGWYPTSSLSGVSVPPTEIEIGGDCDLYASGRFLVGGRIFYVDPITDNGAVYTFYDSAGNVVTPVGFGTYDETKYMEVYKAGSMVADSLATAVEYTYTGTKTGFDRYFVIDTTNGLVGPVSYGGYGYSNGLFYNESNANRYSRSNTGKGDVDSGKDSMYIVFNETTGKLNSGKSVNILHALDSSKADTGTDSTAWAYIDYINDFRNIQPYNSSAVYKGKTQMPGGCCDWFLPMPRTESIIIFWTGAGGAASDGIGSSWGCRWNSAAAVPTDAVKKNVYNWFKSYDILGAGQGNSDTSAVALNYASMWFCPDGAAMVKKGTTTDYPRGQFTTAGSEGVVGADKSTGALINAKYSNAYCFAIRSF